MIRGVCKTAGMTLINVERANGMPDTNYMGKAQTAVKMLKEYDFVLLHMKAPDVASHDKNPQLKIHIIEKIDKMLSYILKNVDLDTTYLAVTADHTTSVITGNHEGDPVPLAVTGPYVRRDDVEEYGERTWR